MENYLILNKKKYKRRIQKIIKLLNLKQTLKNTRTTMFEGEDLEINIDKSIIRVLIYSKEDILKYKKIILNKGDI
jgi:hypothetical protein